MELFDLMLFSLLGLSLSLFTLMMALLSVLFFFTPLSFLFLFSLNCFRNNRILAFDSLLSLFIIYTF